MDFDLTWLLWSLPLAFAAGWLASRFDLRQWRMESQSAPKTYFKGLNFLLNEQQDEAIDAFIQAVQQDPDTTELHFALGRLFRRRGDYDRAVRVHEHLLQRADLQPAEHARARYALAQDFLKAGLLDRAELHFGQLHGTAHEADALLALLSLYERTREWAKAIDTALQLENSHSGSFRARVAHYRCELAQQAQESGHTPQALTLLQQALLAHPACARARLDAATLLEQQDQPAAAFEQLAALAQEAPAALPLAARKLAALARACGRQAAARQVVETAQARAPSIDYVEALADLLPEDNRTGRQQLYLDHLQREPSMVVATDWLDLARTDGDALPQPVHKALHKAAAPLRRYRCAACGFEAMRHFWQCPGCQTWDSYSPRRVDEL